MHVCIRDSWKNAKNKSETEIRVDAVGYKSDGYTADCTQSSEMKVRQSMVSWAYFSKLICSEY